MNVNPNDRHCFFSILSSLSKRCPQTVDELGVNGVRAMYELGLVWLDVPIGPDDRCKIPPLHHYVTNKPCGEA